MLEDENERCYIAKWGIAATPSLVTNGVTTMVEVIPETVGQWIGKKDKTGKLVFEDDIIAGTHEIGQYMLLPDAMLSHTPHTFKEYVKATVCKMSSDSISIAATYLNDKDCDVRVIGNIHTKKEGEQHGTGEQILHKSL